MIPTIIFFLLRQYKRTHPVQAEGFLLIIRKASRIILVFILLLLISQFALPQNTKLEYSIKRKGIEIGSMSFSQYHSGNKTMFKMESEVKTRFIFLITARAMEEAMYENGILVWSSIYQKMNGNERINKKTKLMGSNYVVTKGQQSERISNYPICFNMVCLYIREPISVAKVYSDNFQRFLDIQKLGDHHYKINFPDGNYNEYYYNNGLCSRVEVNHRLYRSSVELKNN